MRVYSFGINLSSQIDSAIADQFNPPTRLYYTHRHRTQLKQKARVHIRRMTSYQLFFQVCRISLSVTFNKAACLSKKSNKNFIGGGIVSPFEVTVKTD